MDSIKATLEKWLNELNNFSFADYEKLPDLDLYMDQVVTFLEKQLSIFQTSSLDKQITSSMINNYVKGEVIQAPISKKYNKEHLAAIEEVITLKQVLTIAEVKQILDGSYNFSDSKLDSFNTFNKSNNDKISTVVEDAFKNLNDIDDNDTHSLIKLALDYALSANAYINVAKRILFLIRVFELTNANKEEQED
ncbi:MAG: DUF1836 domain-containing protein [Erysipelotrichaceae bacterium]|nr:DUF1836 domain-containing protein [Erysipelotrichaceae bacterium]